MVGESSKDYFSPTSLLARNIPLILASKTSWQYEVGMIVSEWSHSKETVDALSSHMDLLTACKALANLSFNDLQ